MDCIPTGSKILDKMLRGGYEKDIITTVYGPAGSGKTILSMLCAVQMARIPKKVIYIDSENNFSLERLKQIAPYDYEKVLSHFAFLRPTTFEEQKKIFQKLNTLVNKSIGLMVVDTIGMLYRLALSGKSGIFEINRELGKQIALLNEIARKKHIPVLLTNQVYADFEKKESVKMVGGDILRYASKCLLELSLTPQRNRKITLQKHRSIKEGKSIIIKIVEGGIIGTKERGFSLF